MFPMGSGRWRWIRRARSAGWNFSPTARWWSVSEITTEEVDVPGRIRVHSASWTVADVAQSGRYVLSAQAGSVVSGLVPVTVEGGSSLLPTVTLATRRTPVQESGMPRAAREDSSFIAREAGDWTGSDGLRARLRFRHSGLDYQLEWRTASFPGSLPILARSNPSFQTGRD